MTNGEDKILDGSQLGQDKAVKFKCANCQTDNVFIMPQMEIANQITFSTIVFAHPEPQYCENCGTPYQLVVKEMLLTKFGIFRLASKSANNLVVPSNKIIVPGGN